MINKELRQKLNPYRTLIAILFFGLCLFLGLSFWLFSPHYTLLFSHLDLNDSQKILSQLEASHINYKLQNQGQDILIDKKLIDKTRIQLLSRNADLNQSLGFELFDKSDFGMTDFSQKINYQRALQGELERSIKSLAAVKQARVHLVLPEKHLFQNDKVHAQAAVSLLLHQSLTKKQIKSIEHLISASVANLKPKNIVIIDQAGNHLNADEEEGQPLHLQAKKSLEAYFNDKVSELLQRIFPEEEFMVKVDLTLNYDQLQRESLKPKAFVSHEKETQHSLPSQEKEPKSKQQHDFSREKQYQFAQEKENFIQAHGRIERLNLSVVLPEETPKETCLKIEALVKPIVGFDTKRGDSLSIEALAKPRIKEAKPLLPLKAKLPAAKPQAEAKNIRALIFLGCGGAFTVVALIYSQTKRRRLKHRQDLLLELNQWLLEDAKTL